MKEQTATGPTVGLALSGGGARGVAHIGVVKALREAGIEPSVVAGTSSGAIVGCLYALDVPTAELEAFAHVGTGIRVMRLGNPLRGLIKLDALRTRLERVLPADDFACLRRPFAVVTSDLQRGRVVVHRDGPLIDCVRASCAVPLLFHPVELGGVQHIDGGLYLNLPAEPIREACDILIGSNVMPLVTPEVPPLRTITAISARVFDLAVHHNASASRELCDVLVEPAELGGFAVYNFSPANELIAVGYEAMRAELPRLRELITQWRPTKVAMG